MWLAAASLAGLVNAGCAGGSGTDDTGASAGGDMVTPEAMGADPTQPAGEQSSVAQLVNDLGHFELAPVAAPTPVGEPQVQGACTVTEKTATEHYRDMLSFDPTGPNLFLGNVVQGELAGRGVLQPLNVPLASLGFSVDGGTHFSGVGTVSAASKGNYITELTRVLEENAGAAVSAVLHYDKAFVHSESFLGLAAGVSADYLGLAEVSANFDWANETVRSRLFVTFEQPFFTASVDQKSKQAASDFFGSSVTPAQLAAEASGIPPVYVQSITYGRRVYLMIESTESTETLDAALEATSKLPSLSGSIESSYQQALNSAETRMRVIVQGGGAAAGASAVDGYEGLKQFVHAGAEFTAENPGVPISYQLAYLDNAVAEYASSATYVERDCVPGACESDDETSVGTDKSDCDEDLSFFEGSLGRGDVDSFAYHGVDDGFCVQQAQVALELRGAGSATDVELCVHPVCDDGSEGRLACEGDSEFFAGACCNPAGSEPVVPFDITCDSGNHSATLELEVTARDELIECVEYQILYRF